MAVRSIKPVIRHIPEYNSDDPLNHRLSALVRLEQFLDERTISGNIIADLKAVALYAEEQGERRIRNMAELILRHARKYRSDSGRMQLTISAADFRRLEQIRQAALRADRIGAKAPTVLLRELQKTAAQPHHPIINAFIASLLKSYQKRSDFSGMMDYRRP